VLVPILSSDGGTTQLVCGTAAQLAVLEPSKLDSTLDLAAAWRCRPIPDLSSEAEN